MGAIEIERGLYFVERGFLNANQVVFTGGDVPAVVDTGFVDCVDETLALMSALGLPPQRVGLIVSTHCHIDHVGANSRIHDLAGCDVALHPRGVRFMAERDAWGCWWSYFEQKEPFFEATHGLEDGDTVVLGRWEWEVLHTPGHSSDGVSLYCRELRTVITGDALWESDTPPIVEKIEGEDAAERALDTLARLERLDAALVLPGHGPPFSDLRGAVARTRRRLEEFRADRSLMGLDLVKKGVVFALLRDGETRREELVARLSGTTWVRETCDRYLGGSPRRLLERIVDEFIEKGIVVVRGEDRVATTVRR